MLFLIRNLLVAFAIVLASFSIEILSGSEVKSGDSSRFIPLITQSNILQKISEGKRVVFVDSRELAEYFEERIPGAHNLLLRNVSNISARKFSDSDIVIAYCLKDFRGFEVAKALKKVGVKNVYTMASPGLNAWKGSKLPIDIPGKTETNYVLKQLMQCAESITRCGVIDSDA